jgi:hypothetical protein
MGTILLTGIPGSHFTGITIMGIITTGIIIITLITVIAIITGMTDGMITTGREDVLILITLASE